MPCAIACLQGAKGDDQSSPPWDVLIRDGGKLAPFREACGDDTHYGPALADHYDHGPPVDWQENFVSVYVSSHTWEDWAKPGRPPHCRSA
jgi:Putative zinc-binding metallo-peptidase